MNKVLQRLLVFFIGIPVVLAIVYIDVQKHLPLNLLIMAVSLLGADELYRIFSSKSELEPKPFVLFLTTIVPVSTYVFVITGQPVYYTDYTFLLSAMLIMGFEVISRKVFEQSIQRISSSVFIVFYCGYLLTYLTKLTQFQNSVFFVCSFLFTVFICDSFAWFFGVLFGKNNKGFIKVSPNKSLAGFIGGYFGAILSSLVPQLIRSDIFYGDLWKGCLIGVLIATSGIIGDLVESAFKRSAGCKDSGKIIPGRGGVLDSIDSIVFSAPVYYCLVFFLYLPAA